MKISHGAAVHLETIVRSVFSCDRCGVCGLVDADIYESHPLEAAIACTSVLYRKTVGDDVEDKVAEFFRKWRTVFDYPDDNQDCTIEMYMDELETIIDMLTNIDT